MLGGSELLAQAREFIFVDKVRLQYWITLQG